MRGRILRGREMKLRTALLAPALAGLLGCSQNQQDQAKERADTAAHKVDQDLHRLGQDMRQDAKQAQAELQKGMNGNTSSSAEARAKLNQAGAEADQAAHMAARKLDRATIIARVKAKLASDAGLSAMSSVGVDVNSGGVVTLHGAVDSPEQKRLALQAASRVDGVTQVRDEITVAH